MPTPTASQRAQQKAHIAALSRLLPLWPHELRDETPPGRRRRIALLRRALRAERRRGMAGHWTYDLSRHAALLACFRVEAAELAAIEARLVGQICPA